MPIKGLTLIHASGKSKQAHQSTMLISAFGSLSFPRVQCLFRGREAQGWLSRAYSAGGQRCLPCLQSTEPQAVAASPFWRSWDGQLPCHALCLHGSPVGKVPQAAMSDPLPPDWSPFAHCPLRGSWGTWAGKLLLFIWEGPPCNTATLANATTKKAHGNACALLWGLSQGRADTPSWGAIRGSWKWKFVRCSSQIHRTTSCCSPLVEETLVLWLTSGLCWARSQSAQALTGTSFPPCPGPKLQARLGRKRAAFQCSAPSLMRHSQSLHLSEELGRQWWESKEEEQEEHVGSVIASTALPQVRLTNGIKTSCNSQNKHCELVKHCQEGIALA